MPSFAAIAVFATLAFSGFSSAVPVKVGSELGAVTPVAVTGVSVGVEARHEGIAALEGVVPRPLTDILNGLLSDLSPVVNELLAVTEPTLEVVKPITDHVASILTVAIAEIKCLASLPAEVLSAADIAGLLCQILTLVLGALGFILSLLGEVKGDVFGLLCDICMLLGCLIQAVIVLVGGLLACLLPLIGSLIPIILQLNVASVLQILGLNL